MSSIDIDAFGMSNGDIDVNLLEINDRYRTDDEHNEWEVHDEAKMGFMSKLGDWENTTLEIVADIESSDANKAVAIIHCPWTNNTSHFHLEIDRSKSTNNKKVFSKNVKIHRHQYSSKVIVISKFLKDDLVIGLSPEFSLFVDEREKPDIDSGLFHFEDANFTEDGDWTELVEQFKGEKFFSSIKQPNEDTKLTIYYNINFDGITTGILDDQNLKGDRGNFYKLFAIYLASGGFISECAHITFYLSKLLEEERDNREANQEQIKDDLYETIQDNFSEKDSIHSETKIAQIASLVFPKEKLSEKDRIYEWWKSSDSLDEFYNLLEKFHMAFQKMYDPQKPFGKELLNFAIDETGEERIDE